MSTPWSPELLVTSIFEKCFLFSMIAHCSSNWYPSMCCCFSYMLSEIMMLGSKGILPPMIHGLLRISCSRNPKTPQIRSFFYEKWLLFGVLRVNKSCFFMQAWNAWPFDPGIITSYRSGKSVSSPSGVDRDFSCVITMTDPLYAKQTEREYKCRIYLK